MDAGTYDGFQRINEIVRSTYDQLVKTRNAQLEYMAKVRHSNKEFGFIITPDLILQYNYVHQLMKSYHNGIPSDICVMDGGITCSNLSVLQDRNDAVDSRLQTYPRHLPVADESNYLASRIIDLLDRPVTTGDQDLTVNVRDEFAANIRTLNLLFEERYSLCQEQSDRLRSELIAVKQELVASREAASEVASNKTTERTIERMQNQITRYETQLQVARGQMEALRSMNEKSIDRNQREVETLLQRLGQSGRDETSKAFMVLIENLVDSLESERNHVVAAIDKIKLVNERRSEELSRLMEQTTARVSRTEPTDKQRDEQGLESRVEIEVAKRSDIIEGLLRETFEKELHDRTEQLKHRFEEEVAARVAQTLESNARVVTADQLQQVSGLLQEKEMSDVGGLKKYKTTLDGLFVLKESITRVVPILPQYELPQTDPIEYVIMNTLYQYLQYILEKMDHLYRFLVAQSGYLLSIGKTAYEEYVPIEYMTKMRTEKFTTEVNKLVTNCMVEKETHQNNVLELLGRVLLELPNLKATFENYYREKVQKHEEALKNKDALIDRLQKDIQKHEGDKMSSQEKQEFEQLKTQNRVYRTTVRDLQSKIDECCRQPQSPGGSVFDESQNVVRACEVSAITKREQSLRNELIIEFRKVYDELARYVINLGKEYRSLHSKVVTQRPTPLLLQEFFTDVNILLDKADRVINFGHSPRPDGNKPPSIPISGEEKLRQHHSGKSSAVKHTTGRNRDGDRWVNQSTSSNVKLGSEKYQRRKK